MSKSGKDNISKRQHLEQVEKQTGKTPKELSGPNPISLLEIRAWVEMTNATLSSREVEAIRELDVIYMRSFNG